MAKYRNQRDEQQWEDGDDAYESTNRHGRSSGRGANVPTWALATMGLSLAANAALALNLMSQGSAPAASGAASAASPAPAAPPAMVAEKTEELPTVVAPSPSSEPVAAVDPSAAAPVAEPAPEVAAPEQVAAAEPIGAAVPGGAGALSVVSASLMGSLPATIAPLAGDRGDALAAAFNRLIMWDVDVRRDLRAGDPLTVAYAPTNDAALVQIAAARFQSGKLGKSLTAYRFQATGDALARYWSADGKEVEFRLNNSPIDNYDQVTSLLKDRPTHHGMDFKTPVGTPVKAPWSGTVTRTNWNWGANGNCVEVQFSNGVTGKYLHLSENKVKPGDRVSAGQVVALSGNTGHSTGPHLHYQLERGGEVLDPVKVHGTFRRDLPAADKARFEAEMARLNEMLSTEQAAR